jgi:hypothetical protein
MTTRERLSSSWFAVIATAGLLACPSAAFAQAPDTPQALRTEIDQLKRDFDALKQQYGDRLSALETKLAASDARCRRSAAERTRAGRC